MKEVLAAGEILPPGQNYQGSAVMRRLYLKVIQLRTIAACAAEILDVVHGFKCVHHWHGGDARWLKKLGCHSDMIDLGQIYNRFMIPVKSHIETAQGLYGVTQSIACVAVGGTIQPPHFSYSDAKMCSTFLGLVKHVLA
jgi:hypothetical protein